MPELGKEKSMSEFVTVIFDANGGGITVSSKRVTRGQPYGELPPPARFGYEFDGWFTAEEGGELVTAETVVTAEISHALYAHWTKNVRSDEKLKAYRKKKASLKRQKIIIAVAVVLMAAAIAGLCVVAHMVNRTNLEDVDGTIYKIIKTDGTYILCDSDENELEKTEDGKYYVTASGSQVKLDTDTGKASIYAYVDTVGREVVGNIVTARVLAFPQVEKKNMARLTVHNEYGSYSFVGVHKNGKNEYYIDGHKTTSYDEEQFASLIVSCGYVLAMSKIEQPIADDNGEYSMYGLATETRTDASGKEYTYTPAWYELTDVNGMTYKVIVGDAIVSGAGYYVQYLNPDYPDTPFIYIVNSDIAKTVLQPVEALVQPMIVYPMTLSTYFNVEDFSFARADSDDVISFSYIPLEERQGTMSSSSPYVFHTPGMETFRAHSTNVDTCLQSFYNMSFVGVTKLAPDDEALVTYGVADPQYMIYFKYLTTDTDNGSTVKIDQYLFVSKLTERGTYYVYSMLFDMIVEVERRYLPFLDYQLMDWIDDAPYSFNLGCTDTIVLQKGSEQREFVLDNSDTAQYTYNSISAATYSSTGYYGDVTEYKLVKSNGKYAVVDGEGETPTVFAGSVNYLIKSRTKTDSKTGTTSVINDLYLIKDKSAFTVDMAGGKTGTCTLYVTQYDKKLDGVLYIFVDESSGAWGTVKREVGSASVRVTGKTNGSVTGAVTTEYFRHFFQTILYATIEGESQLTAEQQAEYKAKPDSEAELVLSISTEGGDFVFRFFRYSERKSFFTINGEGNYYMVSDRVEKIWNDALRVLAGQDVSATDKN